jgi:hypothetical protein
VNVDTHLSLEEVHLRGTIAVQLKIIKIDIAVVNQEQMNHILSVSSKFLNNLFVRLYKAFQSTQL